MTGPRDAATEDGRTAPPSVTSVPAPAHAAADPGRELRGPPDPSQAVPWPRPATHRPGSSQAIWARVLPARAGPCRAVALAGVSAPYGPAGGPPLRHRVRATPTRTVRPCGPASGPHPREHPLAGVARHRGTTPTPATSEVGVPATRTRCNHPAPLQQGTPRRATHPNPPATPDGVAHSLRGRQWASDMFPTFCPSGRGPGTG